MFESVIEPSENPIMATYEVVSQSPDPRETKLIERATLPLGTLPLGTAF